MKLLFRVLLLALAAERTNAAGGGTFYTYFDLGGLGPERWPSLQLEGNQCAGTNLVSGYGQSPVAIPEIATDQCDSNTKNDYSFNAGDCTWDDLEYSIGNNGVKVAPKVDVFGKAACKFGGMRIPHLPFDSWNSVQFHIHSWSEHTIGGEYFNAELHSVHMIESKTTVAATVWGSMISVGAENPVFENYLRGWEKVAADVAATCSGDAPAEEVETAPAEEVETTPAEEEPAMAGDMEEDGAEMVDPEETEVVEEMMEDEATANGERKLAEATFEGQFGAKCKTLVHDPQPYLSETAIAGTTPDFYRHLHNMNDADGFPMYGTYTYKGGLTTPPCSEIVNWNLLDTPFEISVDQMTRLLNLVDCYQNADTCGYETVAAKLDAEQSSGLLTQSSTSRPPQPLQGRTITHRCYDGPNETLPDESPEKPPKDPFTKPAPPQENLNIKSDKCEKSWTKNCPEDARADPTASPNLRVNAPVWNDFAGFWHGTYRAVDRNGVPIVERFASSQIEGDIPYSRQDVKVFKNITIDETKYYEHTYYVFAPASEEFCSLPVPTGAKNALGRGKCGKNGILRHAERFGAATFDKDGTVDMVVSTGELSGTTGFARTIGSSSINFQNANDDYSIIETYSFVDKNKLKLSATGERNIFADYFPYSEDPLAEIYNLQLTQTDAETWIAANKAAQKEANVIKKLPVPLKRECLPPDEDDLSGVNPCAELVEELNAVDPLSNPSPYEEEGQAKGGFIAGMVILGVVVLLAVAYYLHHRQIKKQKDRIAHRFARRVAETIRIEGSHTQLTAEALKEEFDRIDKDHSGMLNKEELRAFVESGKIGSISESDFHALWAALDVDGDGEVNFTE